MTGAPADDTRELHQLKLLFDSTKFHLGFCVALAAACLVLALSDDGTRTSGPWTGIALRAFLVAAFAAGVVAGSCPYYTSFTRLMADRIVPFFGGGRGSRSGLVPTGRFWVAIEHVAFWIGIVAALLSFGLRPFDLGVPPRRASAEGPAVGYAMVLEWNVAGPDYRKLADLGAERAILVCAESEGGVDLQVDQAEGQKLTLKIGGATDFACQGARGHAVSAKSRDGEAQTGKLFVR